MFNPSREQSRLFFCESWRKHRERRILEGAEAVAADLIAAHPEYHPLLEDTKTALEREFTPEGGQMNPFLTSTSPRESRLPTSPCARGKRFTMPNTP